MWQVLQRRYFVIGMLEDLPRCLFASAVSKSSISPRNHTYYNSPQSLVPLPIIKILPNHMYTRFLSIFFAHFYSINGVFSLDRSSSYSCISFSFSSKKSPRRSYISVFVFAFFKKNNIFSARSRKLFSERFILIFCRLMGQLLC